MKRDLREGMKGYYELNGDKYPVTLIGRPREQYGVFVIQFDSFDGTSITRNLQGQRLEVTYRKRSDCFKPKVTHGVIRRQVGKVFFGEWKANVKSR